MGSTAEDSLNSLLIAVTDPNRRFLRKDRRIRSALKRTRRLPLGGTAVGSGLNCPEGFAEGAIAVIAVIAVTQQRTHHRRWCR